MFSKILAGSTFALSLGKAFAGVQFAGINIAGFDFGCGTDGTCTVSSVVAPLSSQGGPDGAGQMAHFNTADGFNMFRLPVAWQYLVNNNLGGTLDDANLANYDALVQACLTTGAYCIIDIHNYARWNGQIIGQGGPSDDDFASLWSQIATKYAEESNVVMGIMNEPHDVPDIITWSQSVQAAVTAIRKAGATIQYCLLPGNDYTSAQTFVSSGSAAALANVTNLDGSTTNLIFDVHKYLDSDGSGTHADCTSNQIDDSFSPLATYLRTSNRQAILSETGGGSDDSSCLTGISSSLPHFPLQLLHCADDFTKLDVCQALAYLDTNSDVYLGYVGWAAGSFASSYVLSLTPTGSASAGWVDQPLVSQCFAAQFNGTNTTSTPAPATSSFAALPSSSLELIPSSSTFVAVSSSLAAASILSTAASSSSSTFVFPTSSPAFPSGIFPSGVTPPGIFPTGTGFPFPTGSTGALIPTGTSHHHHHSHHSDFHPITFKTKRASLPSNLAA
ncbi:Endoglucanase EG-II [Varicellaria rhodocarpa]|nr:Endoglucanase EG-II [Varicellaria rhodocarpa]